MCRSCPIKNVRTERGFVTESLIVRYKYYSAPNFPNCFAQCHCSPTPNCIPAPSLKR
ncbi:hypothetical protein SODALDRAFT_12561 [Sodiomyces alkalinus F11]|uniref:Uncharacterized protein n=1 Tax=Sodiomyces alkalinus (strain CBS 110278 / VKM F-3762 / F11) TaxID=1314773 RepID=A0A3N2Q6C5_SODAK|nr:hypothetical protein SODALDRAFT_12561 [Sodiomyces alkalinus F11]ROT42321.1 hypothetical protein SODALDRAFT_12561 [Sodiomyces alkalinus F11]